MRKLLVALLSIYLYSSPKILIFTFSYNRPDFIEIQNTTLNTFLEDDFELVVFDDSRDPVMTQHIKNTCKNLGLRHIKIPQEIHDRPYLPREPEENYNHPAVRNVNVVQYSLNVLGFEHDDIVGLLDSDLFLMKPFCIRDYMQGYPIAAAQLGNGHVNYLWHGLCFLDMPHLPNRHTLSFNCGKVNGKPIDAGGHSFYYIQNNPDVNIRYIRPYRYSGNTYCQACRQERYAICTHNTEFLRELHMTEPEIEFLQSAHNVEFYYNNTFLHYRGGTNWSYQSDDYHAKKTYALNRYLARILEDRKNFLNSNR